MNLRLVRIGAGILCLIASIWSVRAAARSGLSALYSGYVSKVMLLPGADRENILASAEEAQSLAPSNPDAARSLGLAHLALDEPAEAARSFELATRLRPRHYLLWMELGRAREEVNDIDGAIVALRESVRLAPSFAQPRWRLGNVLFRAGRFDEAFDEVRKAVAADPTLLSLSLELAWAASAGNVESMKRLIEPSSGTAKLTLAKFLAKHARSAEAVELFESVTAAPESEQEAIVAELMAAKEFRAANRVWSRGKAVKQGIATITNPSFEGKMNARETGFGWHVNQEVKAALIELDGSEANDGKRSLRVEWNGASNPFSQLLTQTIVVEPSSHYRLKFAVRVRSMITGGLPIVVVSDAGSEQYRELGQSEPLKEDQRGWREYQIEFTTGEKSEGILISLQRKQCSIDPCPIYARIWLDNFSLERVDAGRSAAPPQ